MLDTHIHSNVSFDGICTRREMALASLKKGGSGLCFTDHYDVVDGSGALVPAYDWYPARQAHRETLEALPGDFMLLYGLELGNVTADFAAGDKALQEPGLDFVLGSIHNAGPAFHRQDYYFECFTSPEQCYTYLDEYFTQLEALTAWGNFDSLAHIPYPLRYMQGRDGQPVSLERYAGCIDGLLSALIRRGQALEVNTTKPPGSCRNTAGFWIGTKSWADRWSPLAPMPTTRCRPDRGCRKHMPCSWRTALIPSPASSAANLCK